jgi:hypothetical protein
MSIRTASGIDLRAGETAHLYGDPCFQQNGRRSLIERHLPGAFFRYNASECLRVGCNHKFAVGEARFGSSKKDYQCDNFSWHCLDCVCKGGSEKLERVRETYSKSAEPPPPAAGSTSSTSAFYENIPGWGSLKKAEKEKWISLIECA